MTTNSRVIGTHRLYEYKACTFYVWWIEDMSTWFGCIPEWLHTECEHESISYDPITKEMFDDTWTEERFVDLLKQKIDAFISEEYPDDEEDDDDEEFENDNYDEPF